MTRKEGLVGGQLPVTAGRDPRHHRGDLGHEEEGLSVRQHVRGSGKRRQRRAPAVIGPSPSPPSSPVPSLPWSPSWYRPSSPVPSPSWSPSWPARPPSWLPPSWLPPSWLPPSSPPAQLWSSSPSLRSERPSHRRRASSSL